MFVLFMACNLYKLQQYDIEHTWLHLTSLILNNCGSELYLFFFFFFFFCNKESKGSAVYCSGLIMLNEI